MRDDIKKFGFVISQRGYISHVNLFRHDLRLQKSKLFQRKNAKSVFFNSMLWSSRYLS